jgi:ubiquinone/menaquinone biosynthesis C-methylase UbiE
MAKTQHREWFENWANEYDSTLGKVRRHHKMLEQAVRMSGVRVGDRVLDIGCGTGLLSLKFIAKKACTITAFDSSPAMVRLFRDKIKVLGLSDAVACTTGSAESISYPPDSFDIAAATVALHHVKDKEPMLRRIRECLTTGGRFLLGEIDMDTTGNPGNPKRMLRILDYLKEEFTLALKEGGITAFERMYDNGKKHILNNGEYCISLRQWATLCRKAGFRDIEIVPVKSFEWFKVLRAIK